MKEYTCGIIKESLENYEFLDRITKYYQKERIADLPNLLEKVWHILEYKFPFVILEDMISALEKELKLEWYIHIFNKEENILYVIFKNKHFKLSGTRDEKWDEMIKYGESVGVERVWTQDIPMSV